MEPLVTIRNRQTGETKQVPQSQLSSFVSNPAPQPTAQVAPPPTTPGFQLTDLLPLLGGIGGGALGALAGPVGAIGGGAVGSGGGEALRQFLTGQNNPGKVLNEGALGLAGGAAGETLGTAGRLISKLAPAVDEAAVRGGASVAAKNLAAGFTVPAKIASDLNVPGALDTIISHGKIPLTVGQAKQLAQTVTGESGLLSTPIRAATTNIKTPINFEQAISDARNQLQLAGLTPQEIKTTMNQIDSHFAPYTGSSAQKYYTQPGYMPGEDAWTVMKQLEQKGYDKIHAGSNNFSPNESLKAQGQALVGVANTLQSQIDKAVTMEGLFPKIKSQILTSLDNNPKVGRDLYKAVSRTQNIDQLRAIQSPYVRISRAADITTNRALAPMAQAGNGMKTSLTGGAAGFGIAGIPGAIVGAAAAPAVEGAAQAARFPLAAMGASAFNAAGKAAQKGTGGLLPQTIGQSGVRMGSQLTNPVSDVSANQSPTTQLPSTDQSFPGNSGSPQQPILTKEEAFYLMAKYPRNQAEIMQLYNLGNRNITTQQEQAFLKNNDAQSIVQGVFDAYHQLGGGQGRIGGLVSKGTAAIGANPQVTAYEGLRQASLGPLARAISGEAGNLSDKDIARAEGLLPKITDTPAEAALKYKNLMKEIAAKRSNIYSSPTAQQQLQLPLPDNYQFGGQ